MSHDTVTPDAERARRRQVRRASLVMLGAVGAWFGATLLGGAMGLDPTFAVIADLACLAALIWALVVLVRAWQAGRDG